MVQLCDTTQARSDSDFGINCSTVQFYAIEHNVKSNRWIKLKCYHKIPEVFVYVGVNVYHKTPPHPSIPLFVCPNLNSQP